MSETLRSCAPLLWQAVTTTWWQTTSLATWTHRCAASFLWSCALGTSPVHRLGSYTASMAVRMPYCAASD